MIDPTEEILKKIERYLKKNKMNAREFGVLCSNDTKLVYGLRNGREMRSAMCEKILAFMKRKIPHRVRIVRNPHTRVRLSH